MLPHLGWTCLPHPGWGKLSNVSVQTYSVPGISCHHCKQAIEAEVAKLEAVKTVRVDVEAKTVEVAGGATPEEVRTAIEEAGYEIAGQPA
jgi:copper chaperone CopZ